MRNSYDGEVVRRIEVDQRKPKEDQDEEPATYCEVSVLENNKNSFKTFLKALDTFGNCQNPVLSLGVSLHMHKMTNLWKF